VNDKKNMTEDNKLSEINLNDESIIQVDEELSYEELLEIKTINWNFGFI
jgi:hypothetical protein